MTTARNTMDNTADVVAFLKAQHVLNEDVFSRVLSSGGAGRGEAFLELLRLLAVQETAEEEIVHPGAAGSFADPDQVAWIVHRGVLGRLPRPGELDGLAVPRGRSSSYVTRQNLAVDGGWTVY